jgi:serine/threonine protein kinase
MDNKKSKLQHSELITISEGSYGIVKLERDPLDTTQYNVVKELKNKDDNNKDALYRECNILKQLRGHPNIVRLKEECMVEKPETIVLEYCKNGDLYTFITKISDKLFRLHPDIMYQTMECITHYFFVQLLEAVSYCHSMNIIHRDIKLENCLIDENYNLKLTDFGFSTATEGEKDMIILGGTMQYMALELIFPYNKYVTKLDGTKIDIFAMGIFIYMCCFNEVLYNIYPENIDYMRTHPHTFKNIVDRLMNFSTTQGRHRPKVDIHTNLRQILINMCYPFPSARSTIEEIKKELWYRDNDYRPLYDIYQRKGIIINSIPDLFNYLLQVQPILLTVQPVSPPQINVMKRKEAEHENKYLKYLKYKQKYNELNKMLKEKKKDI